MSRSIKTLYPPGAFIVDCSESPLKQMDSLSVIMLIKQESLVIYVCSTVRSGTINQALQRELYILYGFGDTYRDDFGHIVYNTFIIEKNCLLNDKVAQIFENVIMKENVKFSHNENFQMIDIQKVLEETILRKLRDIPFTITASE